MALYIMESSNNIEDLVSSLNLTLDEQTALEEAVILEAEEEKNPFEGKSPKEIEDAARKAFYEKIGKNQEDQKILKDIIIGRDNLMRNTLKREYENAPRTWLASKIAAFRSLYTKLEAELDQERSMNRTNMLRKFMRICIKVIDWLALRLQKVVNHIGTKNDEYGARHLTRYRNREFNGRIRALQKKVGIAVNDRGVTYRDDNDGSFDYD